MREDPKKVICFLNFLTLVLLCGPELCVSCWVMFWKDVSFGCHKQSVVICCADRHLSQVIQRAYFDCLIDPRNVQSTQWGIHLLCSQTTPKSFLMSCRRICQATLTQQWCTGGENLPLPSRVSCCVYRPVSEVPGKFCCRKYTGHCFMPLREAPSVDLRRK